MGLFRPNYNQPPFQPQPLHKAVPGSAAHGISITAPAQYRGFTRNPTTASVTVSGTSTGGTPTAVQISSDGGGSWATLDAAPSAGTFSGSVSLAAGDYTLSVRWSNDTGTTASVANIRVGDAFLVIGDSRAAGRGDSNNTYTASGGVGASAYNGSAWVNANDANLISAAQSGGSPWPAFATEFLASRGVPILLVGVGIGATDIRDGTSSWQSGNSSWTTMTTAVTNSGVTRLVGVLANFGSNALPAANGGPPTQAQYLTSINTFVTSLNAQLSGLGAPPIFWDVFGQVTTSGLSAASLRSGENAIRGAVLQAVTNGTIKVGPVLTDQSYGDGVHPDKAPGAGQNAAYGRRYWVAVETGLYSGSNGRGPRPSTAAIDSTGKVVTVTFDRALGNSAGTSVAAGLIVKDGGVAGTITSAVVAGGTRVVAQMASAVAGACTIDFASDDDAAGVTNPTSATITLPSGATITLPAEPFLGQSATAEGSGGTGGGGTVIGSPIIRGAA